jgi:hypothetical protein
MANKPVKPTVPVIPVRKSATFSQDRQTFLQYEATTQLDYLQSVVDYTFASTETVGALAAAGNYGIVFCGNSTTSGSAISIDSTPAITSQSYGQRYEFIADAGISGTATLAVGTISALPIVAMDGNTSVEIAADTKVTVVFATDKYIILTDSAFLHKNNADMTSDITLEAGENASVTGAIRTNGHLLRVKSNARLRVL